MDSSNRIIRTQNPRETANVLSLLTFFYTTPLFTQGFKKDLEDDDIYEVVKPCQSKRCGDKLELTYQEDSKQTNPSTMRVMYKVFGLNYIVLGAIYLLWRLLNTVLEPETISKLVAYFKPGQKNMSLYDAMYYAGIMIGLKLLNCFFYQNYFIYLCQLSIQIRTAFCSVIYRKALKLSPKALARISLGNIVTVITRDVLQFETAIWLLTDLWIAIVQTVVTCYLIYNKIGASSMTGVGILMAYLPIQVFVSHIIKKMRLEINKRTDYRLQATQEALSTIKIIKMYTWEKIFGKKIDKARRKEMHTMMKASYSKVILMASSVFVANMGFYVVVMAYIWLNTDVTAENMFYIMRCFGTLKNTVAMQFSMGFTKIAELIASLHRINIILDEEEILEYTEQRDDQPQIEFRDISLTLKNKDILKNVDIKLEKGLIVVTGQLGCGKSSLIKVALKDYPVDSGELRIRGCHSYASQDPWLFPATIKQNILFGAKLQFERYQKVIDVCALKYDFSVLEKGDETIVADRGLNLSKGQQARINLARAVYKDADIYFLDDTLTALDPRVQEEIFSNCIKDFLKDKLVILVTHNVKHITKADKVIIMDSGTIKFQGQQQDLSKDILKKIENDVAKEHDEELECNDQEVNEKSKLITETGIKRKAIYHEEKKEGGIDMDNYKQYFKAGGGMLFFFSIVFLFFLATFTESGSQKVLTNWINQRQHITTLREELANSSDIINNVTTTFPLSATYAPSDNVYNITTSINLILTTTIRNNLTNETNNTTSKFDPLENQASRTLKFYSFLMIISTLLELVKYYFILKFAIAASVKIHKKMIKSVLYSMMSFFDNFLIGNILNRFSQDLNVIDESFPFHLSRIMGTLFSLGGMVGLILTVNWKFLIPTSIVIVILVIIRCLYIPAGRSLKRLEAATRSPLVGHLNSTLEGMTTIRAFKAQSILKDEFDEHQDVYTSTHFTSLCLRRAYALYMEFVAIAYITYIIMKFLFSNDGTSAGDVGLTITQAAGVAVIVQHALLQWSELENQMTSVERVLEYTRLKPEKTDGIKVYDWPSSGQITYKDVSLTYTKSNEKVLNNINFSVNSREKIGIVGRTGAGKSSIISTLFRLYDYDGQIKIDDVEIKNLSVKFLRNHISIIPQDPIMFSGTVRSNVDPMGQYSDEDIWGTLQKIHLNTIIPSLSSHIEDINFSTGQRQLICVARAIIKKNKIVVLDEATANMDPETEHMVQQIINDNFSECTVFIIAHRLESILDCDKVMVLDRGQIIEFGNPKILLEDPSTSFYRMLPNAGVSKSK